MTEVIVLGAGMVGTATALALQERGWSVTLIDRREPGRETSYGNAGIIQTEAAEPYALPRDLGTLVRIGIGRGNDVRWSLGAMPAHLLPLLSYFRHSAPARLRAAASVYHLLTRRAADDHAPLIRAANADPLIRRDGFHQAYRDPRQLDLAVAEARRLAHDYDVPSDVLDGAALSRAEPVLMQSLAGAIHWTGPWSCADPGGLVAAYAALFVARGGRIAQGDARTVSRSGSGWQLRTETGKIEAGQVVLALGPWSGELAARFGCKVPMVMKRGYHRHHRMDRTLSRPLMDVTNSAVLSPMRAGLRIATGAELTRFDAPATPRQLGVAARGAAELLPLGAPVEAEPWFGHRPCSPDMLPLVGPVPGAAGLWLHFGHGHQGFTLGPTTAGLLAEQMDGAPAAFPALLPERFA